MNRHRHVVDMFFVLTLFGVYAFCALLLCTLGANVYASGAKEAEANAAARTAALYLTQKLRAADGLAPVEVGEKNGASALFLHETLPSGEAVTTAIFLSDGWLCEQTALGDAALGADAGQRLLRLRSLTIQEEDGLYTLTLVDETGALSQTACARRCKGGST